VWRGLLFDGDTVIVVRIVMPVGVRGPFAIATRLDSKPHAQFVGHVLVDGARVRQFFRHTQIGEKFQDQVGLHLQLPRKHVNTDLLHKQTECKRGDS
jgi:hypothetical protein